MFNLPKNTELKQQLPKNKIFEEFVLSAKEKSIIDNNISTLYIVNNISDKTISQIQVGEEIKSLWFIVANLKCEDDIETAVTLILKSIPQKIILILQYEKNYRLACYYEKLLISDYIDENYTINLNGINLDKIYENIVSEIGNITIKDNHTLKEQIEVNERIEYLEKEISVLENKCKNEKQFNKKIEINRRINNLKDELNTIK